MRKLIIFAALLATGLKNGTAGPQSRQQLTQAIIDNDIEQVRTLAGNGADLKTPIFGATPLHLAAEYGRREIAQIFLEKGAEVDAIDNLQRTPLLWAAENQHADVAELLVARGADVNREDPSRFGGPTNDAPYPTPLDFAIRNGDLKLCQIFANAGGKNRRNDFNRLKRAIRSGHPEVLSWLIDNGMDPTAHSEDFDSAFTSAGVTANVDMIKVLITRSRNAPVLKVLLNEALQHAAEEGRLSVVRFLLDNTKVDLNREVKSSYGGISRGDDTHNESPRYTALSRAVENGRDEIVRALLDKGARVAGRTRSGAPVLSFVISQDRKDLFELLMRSKPPLDAVDIDGRTALMTAALNDNVEIAEMLVQHGAAVDKPDRYGATALMLASSEGKKAASEFLIGVGAKIDVHDQEGKSVLINAVNGCQPGLCARLICKGAKTTEAQPTTGMTALHFAAKKPCPTAIRELLAGGAAVEVRDKQGNTPLELARLSGDPESIELLAGEKAP
ncbi:MAG TPA: ankyrin repeat domain-containing protein [Chthoniobacterales bacterium]|nr:ankyrin repeat domain-containing protein [Chthoniobacterales bacterium]